MLNMISTDSASSPSESSASSNYVFGDTIETPTDVSSWVKTSESHRRQTLSQLERLWQLDSEDASRKEYKQ